MSRRGAASGAPALLALLLGGCSLLSIEAPAVDLYVLRAVDAGPAGPRVPWQLIVHRPVAPQPLAGTGIPRRDARGAFGVISGARWGSSGAAQVQGVLLQAFARSGRIVGVGRPASGLRGDFELLLELREFHYEAPARAVRVAISAQLVEASTGRVVAARAFEAGRTVSGAGAAEIVSAFEAAVSGVAGGLVDWTLTSARAGSPPGVPTADGTGPEAP